ncbi:MAG: sugar transferase [Planctomycetes bacterium]|nr:sugar transferase [Planctomycetota bacterium]
MSSIYSVSDTTGLQQDSQVSANSAVQQVATTPSYFKWTGWLNRVLAAILLVPGLPMILVLMVLMRLSSRGPGIYRQVRVGLHGKTFTVYKIRTMCDDAEAGTGAVWSSGKGDPRVTWLGRIYRLLHLDELPQLINVLSGDMNLIGPRPERPEFTQYLAKTLPGYLNRLAVKPGITGLAQIQLPPDTDLESVRLKLATDLQYIETVNAWLDIRILMSTGLRLFGIRGEAVLRMCGFRFGPAGIDAEHRKALAKRAQLNGQHAPVAVARVFSLNGTHHAGAAPPVPNSTESSPTHHDEWQRVPNA